MSLFFFTPQGHPSKALPGPSGPPEGAASTPPGPIKGPKSTPQSQNTTLHTAIGAAKRNARSDRICRIVLRTQSPLKPLQFLRKVPSQSSRGGTSPYPLLASAYSAGPCALCALVTAGTPKTSPRLPGNPPATPRRLQRSP